MGGGGTLQICHILTHVNVYLPGGPGGGTLTRISTFHFSSRVIPDLPEKKLSEADFPLTLQPVTGTATGKIGLLLDPGLKPVQFDLLYEGLRYPAILSTSGTGNVTKELEDAFKFGAPRWWGFKVELPPPLGRFELASLLKIQGSFNVNQPKALSPMILVVGFIDQPFATHHAMGISLLQPNSLLNIDISTRLRQ